MPVEVHYKPNKFIPTVKKGSCTKRVSSLMTVLKSPAATVSVLAYQSVHVGEAAEHTSEDVPWALRSVTHLIICLLKFIPTVQNSSLIKGLAPLSPDKKPKRERCWSEWLCQNLFKFKAEDYVCVHSDAQRQHNVPCCKADFVFQHRVLCNCYSVSDWQFFKCHQ